MKSNSLWAIIILGGFIGLFFWLRTIDWVGMFDIENHTRDTEEKLGDLFWEHLGDEGEQITDSLTVAAMDTMISRICSANAIPREHIKVHVFRADVVNAFAMPGGHLVVYSGLIKAADNSDELAGVLAHEISHIELDHVMKKLIKEIGLSVLITMTSGNGSAETIQKISKLLSSSAFDRKLEKEADISAVEYLINAKINPESLAEFLYKLSENKEEVSTYESWLSTHPDSKKRAEYILQYSKDKIIKSEPALSESSWKVLVENASE
jgi:predicted Zn-dependent protease